MAAIFETVEWKNTSIADIVLTLHRLLPPDFYRFSTAAGIVVAILAPIIALVNSIVIAAIWKDPFKQLRSTPSNIIIGSMAACDFLGGTVCGVMVSLFCFYFSSNIPLSSELASIMFAVLAFFLALSVFHDLALTVDRLIAVINPFLYKLRVRKKRVLISMILIWLFHLIITISQMQFFKMHYVHAIVFYALIFLAIATASFLSLYVIYSVRKQTEEMKNTTASNNHNIIVARQRKLTKSFFIICLVLRICFSPFLITSFLIFTCSSCHPSLTIVIATFFLSIIIMYMNFFINPCLYAFRLPKFKRPVALILKKVFCCPSKDTGELQNSSRLMCNCRSNKLHPRRDKYTVTKL